MEIINKEAIEKKNKKIVDAILISQLKEHKGFEVLKEHLDMLLKNARYPDIRSLDTERTLYIFQGIETAIASMIDYLKNADRLAKQPKINPETGEEEILNNNK